MTSFPRTARPTLALLATGLLSACAGADDGAPTAVPGLALGQPTLEIGAIDGPEPYVFAALETVVRLPDGRLAVSDAGATRIGIYDRSGEHVASWGSSGDGPGEFRSLSRVYPLGRDSLMAAERFSGRLAVFDLNGSFGRLLPGHELSGDTTFVLDSWLYRRFWVDGALEADARRRTEAVLDRLPTPDRTPGYRSVHVADDGTLWIREPRPVDGTHAWTRIGPDGVPTGVLSIPARFRPTHFRGDEVLGVWRGEADVHFVRAYTITAADTETRPVAAWLSATNPSSSAEATPEIDEVMAIIVGSIKSMASAQEIHYSTAMSYSVELDSLDTFEPPPDLWIDFIRGDARGWAAVFVHRDVERACGLAYGFGIPPGWTPGSVVCAPEVDGVEPTG